MKMKIIRNDKSPLNPSHVRYLHRIKIKGTYLIDTLASFVKQLVKPN